MKERVISIMLCLILLFTSVNSLIVASAAEDKTNYYSDAATMITNGTYPTSSDGSKVFAGWYTKGYQEPIYTAAEAKDGAYAKFVDKEVLSVKYQITADTTTASRQTDLRLVTTVDSLNYQEVGFVVAAEGKTTTKILKSQTVYENIIAQVDGSKTVYGPEQFSASSAFFVIQEITGITNDAFISKFTVTPFWVTMDGTTVHGAEKKFDINDAAISLYDYANGLSFENLGDDHVVKGDAGLSYTRVKYGADTIAKKDALHGDYALAVDASNKSYPGFTLDLDGTYDKASQTLKFWVRVDVELENNITDIRVETKNNGTSYLAGWLVTNTWQEISIPLNKVNKDVVDSLYIFVNLGYVLDTLAGKDVTIYYDHFYIVENQYDYTQGVSFESFGEEALVKGDTGLSYKRVKYGTDTIEKKDALHGDYAFSVDASGKSYPGLTLDLDGTYDKASQTLKFWVYVDVKLAQQISNIRVETKNNGIAYTVGWLVTNTWQEISIPLSQVNKDVIDSLYIFVNLGYVAEQLAERDVTIYYDYFYIVENQYDYTKGISFETIGETQLLQSATTGLDYKRVAYGADTVEKKDSTFGKYAMAVNVGDVTTYRWPEFKLDLDDTYAKSENTTLKFWMYVKAEGVREGAITLHARETDRFEIVEWISTNKWVEIKIPFSKLLDSNVSSFNMFVDFNRGDPQASLKGKNVTIYYDKFYIDAYAPDYYEGLGFEHAIDTTLIDGWKEANNESLDATIERIDYATAGITPPADGGAYALKLSTVDYKYPRFKLKFGKVIPKGATLSFMAYCTVNSQTEERIRFEAGNNMELAGYYDITSGAWHKVTLTLKKSTDELPLWFASFGEEYPTAYLDNIQLIYENDFALPTFFSDGMLFQRNKPMNIWGMGTEDYEVTAKLYSEAGTLLETKETTVSADGEWELAFAAREGSYDKYTIEVTCLDVPIEIKDVLVGELWMAAGQSNMELIVDKDMDRETILQEANNSNIRILLMPTWPSGQPAPQPANPLKDIKGAYWGYGNKQQHVLYTSSLALTFAKKLEKELNVPVGIINNSVGGYAIEAWLSREAINNDAAVKAALVERNMYRDENSYASINGGAMSTIYNQKVGPLEGMNIAGVLWYQGESNIGNSEIYDMELHLLKRSWSQAFGFENGDMPLIFTQIAPYSYQNGAGYLAESMEEGWQLIKDKNTAMLTVYDLPLEHLKNNWSTDPIHPRTKIPVGERFFLSAKNMMYGGTDEYTAPVYKSMEIAGNAIYITFEHVGNGGLTTTDGAKNVHGFTIAGSDGVYVNAYAEIVDKDTVKVWNDHVTQPKNVMYAFTDMNQGANLCGSVKIPAAPFRTFKANDTYKKPDASITYFTAQDWMYADKDVWVVDATNIDNLKYGYRPSFEVVGGTYQYDTSVYSEGIASLKVTYEDDFSVSPITSYDSVKQDWSKFNYLSVDLHSTATVKVTMKIESGGQTYTVPTVSGTEKYILNGSNGTFETITFDLSEVSDSILSGMNKVYFEVTTDSAGVMHFDSFMFGMTKE